MKIDSNNLQDNTVIETDICVVGAGVAGISFAREFINTDKEVVLLESGREEPCEEVNAIDNVRSVGFPYSNINHKKVRAIGGSSHSWHVPLLHNNEGLRLRSLDPIDFEKRDWVPYSGWPFTKKQLDPYYEKAQKLYEVGPGNFNVDYWSKKDRTKFDFEDEFVKNTIYKFSPKELFSKKYPQELIRENNIIIYTNATALNICLNENTDQIKKVIATNLNGVKFEVKATFFVLALGGLQTPRLLLSSNNVMKAGIGNQNDLVGRFFMDHLHIRSGIFFPSDDKFFEQPSLYDMHEHKDVTILGKFSLSKKTIQKEKLLNFTASIHHFPMVNLLESEKSVNELISALKNLKIPENLRQNLNTICKNLDLISYISLRKILKGDKEKWYGEKYRFHGYKFGIMAEQTPDPESRIMLDDTRNRFGQNEIKVKWKLNSDDIRSIRRSQEIIDREFRRNKVGKLKGYLEDDSIPDRTTGGWHYMGTTRMSSDPQKGVVNENCRIHGIDNLYVAGSSVFPTCGCANPSLTISALAIRLADHIKK